MKVCFDTCVIIDILGRTKNFEQSFCALDIAYLKNFEACCSTSSTTDIAYLMHSRGFAKTQAAAKKSVSDVLSLFTIISNNESDVKLAYLSNMKDYEEALIAYSAKRAGTDFIVTRNKKDFVNSPVTAITPTEFVETFKPNGYVYEEVDLQ